MKLSDVATIELNYPEADFWIIRRGSLKTCGLPTYEFNKEHIGIKVERTDLILVKYLFYCMNHLHSRGEWEKIATGTLKLVNIRVTDVREISLKQR